MNILIIDGLGHVGSNFCMELLKYPKTFGGFKIICVDKINDHNKIVVEKLILKSENGNFILCEGDYGDLELLNDIFCKYQISSVIHFAEYEQSLKNNIDPLIYFENHITNTMNLLKIMKNYNCKKIIYSSSGSVYGEQEYPVSESFSTGINLKNHYSQYKYFAEQLLHTLYESDNSWKIFILRCFNLSGCGSTGLADPNNNIFSKIKKVACLESEKIIIYGSDYKTNDGTCIRDYIHVSDLVEVYILCLNKFNLCSHIKIYNIGTGVGTSVKELIDVFIKISGVDIPYEFGNRRPGDLPVICCYCCKAIRDLDWYPSKNVYDICYDTWNCINKNRL